jgi:regulator of protease activity HflC (stomatin/prohibitin superfamily)
MAQLLNLAASPSETHRARRDRLLRALESNVARLFILLFVLVFFFVYFAPNIFITVHSGEVGVMFRRFFGGTQTDRVLGEGLKIIPPWDHLFLYTVRVQEEKAIVQVLTKEGLSVTLHLSIRYHPEEEMVGMLHKTVGTEYKERIVIPEVEAAMRTVMGEFEMREVYGSERGLVQKVINDSLEHVSQKYVKIDSVVLRRVELPPKVADAIQDKMTQKEIAEAYEYRMEQAKQESARQQIEASGIKSYNDLLNSSLTPNVLKWEAIKATKKLAESPNTKVIIMGNTSTTLPLMLSGDKEE